MGLERECVVRLNGKQSHGRAHCGDGEIDFLGDFRFRWLWKELTTHSAREGVLTVSRNGEVAEFELGDAAEKWLNAIRNPKGRMDKLGLKAGQRYGIVGEFDRDFLDELCERAGESTVGELDAVFIRLESVEELDRLRQARPTIAKNGMIWAVWPKGRKELREDDIRKFALANGLVDVKVASFSDTLSALKLVIPVALR